MKSVPITYFRYRPAAWLRMTGADAETFLQGQFTNDLRNKTPLTGVYGLFLNQKGKTIADGFVMTGSGSDEFLIGSYFCPAANLLKRLGDFIVADEVEIEDLTSGVAGISLMGDGAGEWLGSSPREGSVFHGRRSGGESWEWVLPENRAGAAAALLAGAREFDALGMEQVRIAAGIAAVPQDIGPGDLPNEGGLESVAISYDKGCYLGQEIMARLKTRGRLRRSLMRVKGNGPAPVPPAPLWQAGRLAGQLRSAVPGPGGFLGLALMNLDGLGGADPSHFLKREAPRSS